LYAIKGTRLTVNSTDTIPSRNSSSTNLF